LFGCLMGTAAATGVQVLTELAVPAVGTMHDIPGAKEMPDPALDYKLAIDVQMMADSPDEESPGLDFIGGLINTFRKAGVPADHLHVTAVFHGKSILLVANDKTYRERTGAAGNPNVKLLGQLEKAGVNLVVCGQSARGQHFDRADLLPSATMNLSATVTFINLQARGYVKVED
jgi:intracellular sulfur oxidation DsrE/DsrF family protein